MKKIFKRLTYFIISIFVLTLVFVWSIKEAPNANAADLKTVVLKSTDFTGEGEGSDNPWTLSNSSWALSNLAFYNFWNKDEIKRTEDGQGSAFSSSITYNNPSKYAIISVKVYGAGQNHSNTVDVSVTCGSETTATQTVTKDGTDLTFNLSTNPTSSVVVNFQHPAHTNTATIELSSTQEEKGQMTFIEITAKEVYEVSISSGTGVKSVYLSTNQSATSGSSSGTKFDKGTTVYGFAKLAKGYKAKSGWTLVSGSANTENAIYRVGNKTVGSAAVSFGTISADLISYTIGYTLNDGSVSGNPTSYNVTSNAITLNNPTKTGYTFKGWTGSNGSTPQTSVSIAKGSIGDKTYTANWTLLPVIQDVIDKINNIGTVTYPDSKGLINTAKSAYDALDASYKGLVSNYETLTTAEGTYNTLKTNAVNNVKNLIDTIGTVAYPTSKAAIGAAESAYAALDSDEKNTTAITNYATLTGARTEYDAQRNAAVQAVIAAIDAIGEVTYPGSKAAIMNAEDLYAALDSDEKNTTTITNYTTLTGDRTEYNSLRDAAVLDVIDKIDDIEIPLVYPGSNTQISSARSAYDALCEDEKNTTVITNYQDLLDVEAAYQVVVEENEIGTPYDTQEFRDKVLAVRNNYNDLTNTQKSLFPDSEYTSLVNYEKGIPVMDKINLIGDVDYNDTSKGLIEAAREAYEELTEGQKALVANYDKLVDAEKAYEAMSKIDDALDIENTQDFRDKVKAARDYYDGLTDNQKGMVDNYQNLVDREAVINFMDKVNLIGDSEDTQDFRDKVKAAREAYDGLTDAQKELVSEELLNTLLDNENAISAMDKINLIGDVKYTIDSKKLIDDAREAYNNLTAIQKELVVNLEKLTKAEDDYNAVDKVAKEINSIGDIRYDEESHKKIEEARKSYESLTKDQKAFFPANTLQKLEDYEESYETLEIIYSIGDVKYTHESEELIAKARERYNALTDDQKSIINENDLNVLTISETQYTNTKTSSTVWLVILMILTIIAIGGAGFILFLLLKKKDNDHNEPKKAMSVTGLPFIILASHLTDAPYIIFYIFIGIAVVFWIVDLVIFILKKKGLILKGKEQSNEEPKAEESNEEKLEEQAEESEEAAIEEPVEEPVEEATEEPVEDPVEEPFEESADEPVEEPIEEPTEETVEEATEESTDEAAEEDEVVAMEDEQGNVFKIRFNKSFTAKLIQSSDDTKSYYQELKNEVLSYKKVTSRTSWAFDSINNGRNNVIRFGIRGKTLCVYYPLNALDYADSKYKVENIESKKYADTPCMYRIKNERRLSYAKELITVVCEKLQLVKGDNKNENYYLPYEDNQALIEKGLIKETKI